ncbi:MAG: hypothetical protein ACLFNT_05245 [Spirochaetales bacterium]
MRKTVFTLALVLVLIAPGVATLDEGVIERADALYENDQSEQAISVLEGALGSARNDRERAEVLWRLSRATLAVGESLDDAGASEGELTATYEAGEQYGIEAVEADPNNHLGYYWQSANIGRWGQTKGVLNSLFKAGPMRDLLRTAVEVEPEHAGSYYVLGQLYSEVPGLISFGNVEYAVGLARKSIDLHEAELRSGEADEREHDYYIQLANHLIKRDWNERKRAREHENQEQEYRDASNSLERGWYYEGTVRIPSMSDEQEAREILEEMIASLRSVQEPSDSHRRQLERAQELMGER